MGLYTSGSSGSQGTWMGIPRTGGHQTPTTEKHLESVGERVTRKKCDDSENKVARASAENNHSPLALD